MKQKVVAFVGISGAGKTTFLRQLSLTLSFQCLSAGSLIAAEKEYRDSLRLSDIADNQQLLVDRFHKARDESERFVFMDGHAVIHTPNGLEAINSEVFSKLETDAILHLIADPSSILANRVNDAERDRPLLNVEELKAHQNYSIAASEQVAQTLEIPMLCIAVEEVRLVEEFLIGL